MLRAPALRQPAQVQAAFAAIVASQVRLITTLNGEIAQLGEVVADHFGRHRDAEIYASQPGLGVILGARVLAEFGDDRTRFADAKARKNYAGTSPITRASGTKKVVLARYARNERLGDAVQQWAFGCAERITRRARLLRRAPSPQDRPPSSATPTRQPARRHPARLPEDRHPLRRKHRLGPPPHAPPLDIEKPGMSVALAAAGFGGDCRVIRSMSASSAPAGYRFPREVIAVAVRWYLRYGLSYRDVEELLAERGIEVDHVTVYRWVQTFTPEFIDAARPAPARYRRSVVRRRDLRQGRRPLDLPLPSGRSARPGHRRPGLARRDGAAARAFFTRARDSSGRPRSRSPPTGHRSTRACSTSSSPPRGMSSSSTPTTGSKPTTVGSRRGCDRCAD